MPTVKAIAQQCRRADLPVINTEECSEECDGMVEITKRLHIQVPKYGRCCIVEENDVSGAFLFYPPWSIVTIIQVLKGIVKR